MPNNSPRQFECERKVRLELEKMIITIHHQHKPLKVVGVALNCIWQTSKYNIIQWRENIIISRAIIITCVINVCGFVNCCCQLKALLTEHFKSLLYPWNVPPLPCRRPTEKQLSGKWWARSTITLGLQVTVPEAVNFDINLIYVRFVL